MKIDKFTFKVALLPLVAMLIAAAMLRASGAMDLILRFVSPFTQKVGLPSEILPLVLIRPVSGSGSIGVLSGILNEYGPDSMIGRMASVICASTETTFYCMAVYFAKTRVKTIKKAAIGAVIGDLAGICAATFVLRVLGTELLSLQMVQSEIFSIPTSTMQFSTVRTKRRQKARS